ncbi:MAG: SDR family oxidoreductase [Roseibium sp.]|uniref:SDR family NAD(P)-dependent oxidoreductase n=1 Tax=Roseibium sp. TaxID=1936156 RepID=UPI00262C40CD|nr:SDR family NAD(P)-dependent oxidoreductase [Roseibium sp.]MCV0427992.1 SDR family oxidoreductase [Roseibium sp.]
MEKKLLEGKVALVTGAGRGVGRDIALMMAEHGASIIVNDIGSGGDGEGLDNSPARNVVDEIQSKGGIAAVNYGSVSNFGQAKGMVEQAVDSFGRLDIVVNNAGILRDAIFHKMSEQDFDQVVAVHLKGSFNVSRNAADVFRSQQSGCFVHMTSTSGLVGNLGQANYMSAKLGIVGLSKSIALDMARYNVRSNCISPFAWSRMTESIPATTPEEMARVEKLRQMTPDKIAVVATALAADENVTGQIFAVRNNEIFLMGQSRPLRGMQRSKGWSAATILDHAFPALRPSFYGLDRTTDVFTWEPV